MSLPFFTFAAKDHEVVRIVRQFTDTVPAACECKLHTTLNAIKHACIRCMCRTVRFGKAGKEHRDESLHRHSVWAELLGHRLHQEKKTEVM